MLSAKSAPILEAHAEQGEMTNENNTPAMRLTKVRAKIFQQGRHTANLVAGQMVSNRKDRVLVGTEGVQLTSLQNPAATTLTAENMRWDMRSSKALAFGSAKIVKRATGKSPEGTVEAPKIWFDTKTGEYEVTQGD